MAKKNPRLQFTDAELNPKLKHHVRRANEAADKAEAARAKLPKNRKKLKRRMIDQHNQYAKKKKGGSSPTTTAAPSTPKKRLYFEEVDKSAPPSKLSHTVRETPGAVVSGTVHWQIQQTEQDNVGVESAHKL